MTDTYYQRGDGGFTLSAAQLAALTAKAQQLQKQSPSTVGLGARMRKACDAISNRSSS